MTLSRPASPERTLGFADRPRAIALLLAAGLLLRLLIAYGIAPGQGLTADLDYFKNSAITLAEYGPGGFVAHNGFYQPAPVGYLYFLWPLGVAGRFLSGIVGQPADEITFALLKLPAILADIGVAVLLYRAARTWYGGGAGLVAAALYLFIPVTWYESALFGQVDSVGMLFLLGALLLLLEGWSEPAVAMGVLAALIKPQYAIVLVVIGPILLRRHVFLRGSGPIVGGRSRIAALDRVLVGWFTRRQGFERLVSSALVAMVVFVAATLPFDLPLLAPPDLVGIPVVSHVAGFIGLLGYLAGYYNFLTANAYNVWTLVGPVPLSMEMSRDLIWTYDSLEVIGSMQAVTVGTILLAAVVSLVAGALLLRDDRAAILGSFTVLALAFFALPTRVHERYLFPIFVVFALLVAGRTLAEKRWRWWYIAMGILAAVNLHAVATLSKPGYATPGLINAPLGNLFRSEAVVIAASLANTGLFALLFLTWLRGMGWPAFMPLVLRIVGRGPSGGSTDRDVVPATTVPSPSDTPRHAAERGGPAGPGALAAMTRALARVAHHVSRPVRARLNHGSPPDDNSAALAGEEGGRLDRRDVLVVVAILALTFAARTYRIDTPRTMYFDELYYPATATEFLQDWRYGIATDIFEWTHPHVSKYVQALSLAAFGNDRATSVSTVGAPVRNVAFDPAHYDPAAVGGYSGDRIAVATGDGVRIAPHGIFSDAIVVPLPGATVVAFDHETQRLYVATGAGDLWAIDGSAMDGAGGAGSGPQPVHVGRFSGSVTRVLAIGQNRVAGVTSSDSLTTLDGTSGETLATISLPGLTGLVIVPVGSLTEIVATVPAGLIRLDASTLMEVSQTALPARPTGLELVDGSDFGWRNNDTLPVPTLYVALESGQLAAVQVGGDGTLTLFDTIAMPGPVVQVQWDRPSNMVHVLGQTAGGDATIYVVEPHTNSVFADARIPFEPVAWMLDVQPDTPSLDRQQALVFSASGTVVYLDTGSHAWAWRVPGVIAGTLTAGLMYLMARMLFRRRKVAVLLAIVMALDGLLFIQGRVAMNDSLLGLFIVAAFTLLLALFRAPQRGVARRLIPLVGLPAVGLLLGLALGTKWVGAYAIGGAVLLVLARTQVGRWLALGGLLLITGVFGFQALAGEPPNLPFLVLMLGITVFTGVLIVRAPDAAIVRSAENLSSWVNPRRRFGIPFVLALACLVIIPAVVYVVSYIPWTLSSTGDPQLFTGWPPDHTGQTFLDLQSQMYHYHNDLRTPHAASSPWWAWPFGLKPVWGHLNTQSDGTQVLMLLTANPVLLWLAVPAIGFGIWKAWRRRSAALAFVLIAFLSLWLPWARIDRVAYNYHWYTPLPFVYLLLAYFLAELWDGPSRRIWSFARVAFAVVLLTPALMWIFKDGLCALAGVAEIYPESFECGRPLTDIALPLGIWLIGSLIAAWFILGAQDPRRLVASMIGAAAIGFAVLYPALSALPIPNGWPFIYQGLLPTWDISFRFNSNTSPVSDIPLLGPGALAVALAAGGITWLVMRRAQRPRPDHSLLRAPVAGLAGEAHPAATEFDSSSSWVRAPNFRASEESSIVAAGPALAAAATMPEPVAAPARALQSDDALLAEHLIDRYGIPVALFFLATLAYSFVNHGRPATLNYFVPLADALVHGQLGLSAAYSWLGEVVYGPNGLYNVVYPPAPAVLLMPLALLFGPGIDQTWASILLGALNVALMSLILQQMGFARLVRVVLSLVFGFGTIVWYSAQAGTAWHFSHVCSIFFVLLTILACQRNARTWMIGLLFAGAVLSRLPLIAGAPFLLAYLAYRTRREAEGDRTPFGTPTQPNSIGWRGIDLNAYLRLAAPVAVGLAIPLALYLAYNQVRFGSIFETGTAMIPGLFESDVFRDGLFSLRAIPGNLVAMFLAAPNVVPGFPFSPPPLLGSLSVILTTPLLLWAFMARPRDWFTVGCWVSIGLLLVPTLLRADPGGVQFGFRYAQDFYPFLFLLAVRGLRGRIGPVAWMAIAIGFAVNLWGMAATYFNWWA